ncbi:MAG: uroporphyrinogen decarboxylase, partial [Gammaproteobacteria bacterium]|nr:uroporphyrinogen decarboxylase [Gammaproteobacteria bacterium]
FRKTIRSAADVDQLPDVNIASELSYVTDAVSVIRKELNGSVPLIGFSGSPWTLATYMIEGGGSKDFRIAKQFMYDNPEAMHLLLEKLASAVIDYLNAQIKAGAQAVQIFDTWGGILTPAAYREFSLNYMNKIVDGLIKENDGRQVPAILFTKNGGQWLEDIADSGCQAIGLDWTTDIGQARARIGDRVALQGNMDPTMLYASPQAIRKEVGSILQSFGQGAGHVFNLGHGITPEVNPDNVAVFVESVHELSAQYHA